MKYICPICGWRANRLFMNDLWQCDCGAQWNTFDTGGVCPKCKKVWEQTCCLKCRNWSKHSDWYRK